jgi:hypothetical protein
MTREYSCRKPSNFSSERFLSQTFLFLISWITFKMFFYFLLFFVNLPNFLFFFWFRLLCGKHELLAELRSISLACDYDRSLLMQKYPSHRKLSSSSHWPTVSNFSGTESQQSLSSKSFHGKVDIVSRSSDKFDAKKSSQYLLPPSGGVRHSLVNRSKSFQEPGFQSNILLRRKNLKESNRIEDRFESISNSGSALSETNVNYAEANSDVETLALDLQNCSCHKTRNGPFIIKILRRLQKLSLQWRKCKRVPRGRSFSNYISYVLTAIVD